MCDTDLSSRLKAEQLIKISSTPSLKYSWMRKLSGRCTSYERDFVLQCYLFDVALARQITAMMSAAEKHKMSPDEATVSNQHFSGYWAQELQRLEDVCRQQREQARNDILASGSPEDVDVALTETGLPNLFITVSAAEWLYPVHGAVLGDEKENGTLSDHQTRMTIHIRNTMVAIIKKMFTDKKLLKLFGIKRIIHYSIRLEFQKRGTPHTHTVAHVEYEEGASAHLTGRSGEEGCESPLVRFLEAIFKSSVDVQASFSSAKLLRYVAGYVAKSSDALNFKSKDNKMDGNAEMNTRWRQTFRMLCKRSVTEQEIALDFAGLSLMENSFTSDALYCPIPGSAAQNKHRQRYNEWLRVPLGDASRCGRSFADFVRNYRTEAHDNGDIEVKERTGRKKKGICAVAFGMPFELLDIF